MADAQKEPARRRGRPPSGGREAILAATLELLRERGISRLTTREIAARAGTSEASIFYHYGDRVGLLQAVFARGLEPLKQLNIAGLEGSRPVEGVIALGTAIERFLVDALPVLIAAQSDTTLREGLASYLAIHDLGPHRGVEVLSAYLVAEQEAGTLRRDADADAAATMLIGSIFLRVFQRQIAGTESQLPSLEAVAVQMSEFLSTEPS